MIRIFQSEQEKEKREESWNKKTKWFRVRTSNRVSSRKTTEGAEVRIRYEKGETKEEMVICIRNSEEYKNKGRNGQ